MASAQLVPAVQVGYRLHVSGTMLWFNVDAALWAEVQTALTSLGGEVLRDGMEGEEVCQAGAVAVSYGESAGRMRAEVDGTGATDAVAALNALHRLAPTPDAETSTVWLWAADRFAVGGRDAQEGRRVMRAARWVAPVTLANRVLSAAADASVGMGGGLTMRISVGAGVTLDLSSPPDVSGEADVRRRAQAFGTLIGQLGAPGRAEYATVAGWGAWGGGGAGDGGGE